MKKVTDRKQKTAREAMLKANKDVKDCLRVEEEHPLSNKMQGQRPRGKKQHDSGKEVGVLHPPAPVLAFNFSHSRVKVISLPLTKRLFN